MSIRAVKDKVRGARQALYREHILDAAEQVFAAYGYDDAKVVAMSEAAGVSLATVYRSFETKWDIYCAVHARRTAALGAYVRDRVATSDNPLALMLNGIAAYFEFHMRNPNYLRMHLRGGYAWCTAQMLRSPEQIAAWNEGLAMMTQAFAAGIRAGLYPSDERPELMARTMVAMHQVRLADWVDRGMKESVERVTRDVHREFVRTFCTAKGAARAAKWTVPGR
jgi:AcrR family transcriptional regulator